MKCVFDLLRPVVRGAVQHAVWVLLGAVLLSAGGLHLAQDLTIDTDIANLVPDSYDSVQALETLEETLGGGSGKDMAVAIVSPSFEANKAFAEDFIPKALSLKRRDDSTQSYLRRVEYKREVEFLQENALYFASDPELAQVEDVLQNKIEEAKQARREANPFYVEIDEDEEADSARAENDAEQLQAVYDRVVGKRYPISGDSTTMALRFYPSSGNTNLGFIENLYADVRTLVDRMEPASYHPEMKVVLSGRLYRQLVQVQTIRSDVAGSFGVGVACVVLIVILYFFYKAYRARAGGTFNGTVLLQELLRAPFLGLLIGLPLFMSLTWTGGAAYLLFGELNLMTSTLGLILFGLGIDYGIHFYGRYAEERAQGQSIVDAVDTTFTSTGQAIAIGALTTAVALYVLTLADFKGFSEFGAVAGTGVIFAFLATVIVMPALLALFERIRLLDLESAPGMEPEAEGSRVGGRFPGARTVVVGSGIALVAALAFLPRVQFQYDFGALEPAFTEYDEKSQYVGRTSTGGQDRDNPAYIVADSQEDVPEIVQALRTKMRTDTTSPTILAVESLQERFPVADTAQQRKLRRIAEIQQTATENRFLKDDTSEGMQKLRRGSQTRAPISLDQVPEFLREEYTTKDGDLGQFVIVYPSVGVSDGRKSIAFAKDVGTVTTEDGDTYHAGSTQIVAAEMLMILQREAPWMIGGVFLVVALLMLLHFRDMRWALMALIPLVVGILWMLLLMEVFGLMVNFYNMIVLPALLGIGNDDGVHMVHRYREEGHGSIGTVLRSTGEHVFIGNLTTAVGFGGLVLSFHPGLNSIGTLAVVGFGTTLLAALVFLPALFQWLEDADVAPGNLPDAEPSAQEGAA
ncbi:MAG: transporter [Bacteroidetes bacterium SW_9_63_38]|nr:MAG: transporter [Bacteroidetes bacterium SW_9_63_38]